MAYSFYVGTTFNYMGNLQLIGPQAGGTAGINKNQPDFSQWAVSAALYDQAGEKLIETIAVSNNSTPALPSSNGLFLLTASASQTASWPIGKAQLILQVTTDTGTVLRTDPVWLRIQASPGVQQ